MRRKRGSRWERCHRRIRLLRTVGLGAEAGPARDAHRDGAGANAGRGGHDPSGAPHTRDAEPGRTTVGRVAARRGVVISALMQPEHRDEGRTWPP